MAKTIHTDKAPAAIGPYVQGKIVGNLLFASGQVPLSPETGEIIEDTEVNPKEPAFELVLQMTFATKEEIQNLRSYLANNQIPYEQISAKIL